MSIFSSRKSCPHRIVKAAIFFSNFGPYHHSRVVALQDYAIRRGESSIHLPSFEFIPIELASSSAAYSWHKSIKTCSSLLTLFPNKSDTSLNPCLLLVILLYTLIRFKIRLAFIPSYWPYRIAIIVIACKLLGVRTIMMTDSHAETAKARGFSFLVKLAFIKSFSAYLVAGTRHSAYLRSLGLPKKRIFTGFDAVDNSFFSVKTNYIKLNPHAYLNTSTYNILPPRYLLCSARPEAKKNFVNLLHGFKGYVSSVQSSLPYSRREGYIPFSLVLLGPKSLSDVLDILPSGVYYNIKDFTAHRMFANSSTPNGSNLSFTSLSQSISHGSDILLYGFRQVDELPFFYANASALVLPSTEEEWGLVVNEAMASSLPILASRNLGCLPDLMPSIADIQAYEEIQNVFAEYFPHNLNHEISIRSNGFVFDPLSVEQITDSILALDVLSHDLPNLYSLFSSSSYSIVSQWGCENFASQALHAADSILTKGS